jgi:hypothetical protein
MNRLAAAAFVSLAPIIAGCSKSPDTSGSAAASGTSAQVAAAPAQEKATPKACDLVTAKEMSVILGSDVVGTPNDGSNGKTECVYKTDKPITHSTPYADLSIDWGSGEGAMQGVAFLNKHEPGIADPYAGIGDQAVAMGPTLMIKTGDDLMTIILSDVDDVPGTARKIFKTAKPRM